MRAPDDLSPSSVYRVLNEADLLYRWKRSARSGEAPPKPMRRVVQQALEMTGVRPAIGTDNGSQFTAAEFKDLVRRFSIEHIGSGRIIRN